MIINIDYRETKLIELIKTKIDAHNDNAKNVKNIITLEISNLPLGDITLSHEKTGKPIIIIERKSVKDLAGSIRDGRYNEQSARLNEYPIANHNIVYLIEGSIRDYKPPNVNMKNPITYPALYSSLISVLYYKGFSVLRTVDVQETAELLYRITDKISRNSGKNETPYYSNKNANSNENANSNKNANSNENANSNKNANSNENSNTDITDALCSGSNKKSSNITPDNIGIIMLCQIPGIGKTAATAIMNEYDTIGDLINDLREDKTCLNNLKYSVGTQLGEGEDNKQRKISKTVIDNLIKYLVKADKS